MRRVAVVGLGLIGGSAALAFDAKGYDRNPEVRERARRRGIRTAETLAEALEGAEVAMAAVSTAETPAALREILSVAPAVLMTDTASLKKPMVLAAHGMRASVRFVGGHPMAGSRRAGVEAAEPTLFRGRPWALVSTARSDPASIALLSDLVQGIGARPFVIDAERHDALMTWISHLPHAVAVSLVRSSAHGAGSDLARLAGPGFLDSTRIAGRRLDLAMELATADPEALADAIEAACEDLGELARALRDGRMRDVRRIFSEASEKRLEIEPE